MAPGIFNLETAPAFAAPAPAQQASGDTAGTFLSLLDGCLEGDGAPEQPKPEQLTEDVATPGLPFPVFPVVLPPAKGVLAPEFAAATEPDGAVASNDPGPLPAADAQATPFATTRAAAPASVFVAEPALLPPQETPVADPRGTLPRTPGPRRASGNEPMSIPPEHAAPEHAPILQDPAPEASGAKLPPSDPDRHRDEAPEPEPLPGGVTAATSSVALLASPVPANAAGLIHPPEGFRDARVAQDGPLTPTAQPALQAAAHFPATHQSSNPAAGPLAFAARLTRYTVLETPPALRPEKPPVEGETATPPESASSSAPAETSLSDGVPASRPAPALKTPVPLPQGPAAAASREKANPEVRPLAESTPDGHHEPSAAPRAPEPEAAATARRPAGTPQVPPITAGRPDVSYSEPGPGAAPSPELSHGASRHPGAKPENTTETRPDPEPPAQQPAPVRGLTLRLEGHGQKVDLRLAERGGEIRVAVHAPEGELRRSLQEQLPELVRGLDRQGYSAEIWRPAETSSRSDSGDRGAQDAPMGGGHGGAHQDGRGRRRNPSPDWLEEVAGQGTESERNSWQSPA